MRYFLVLSLIGIVFISGCANQIIKPIMPDMHRECSADSDCQSKIQARCIGAESKCAEGKCQVPSRCLEPPECFSDSGCKSTGCSGQICSHTEVVSTCEYKSEYDCFKNTTCGCINNKCQWADTPQYKSCLENLPKGQEQIF